MHLPGLLGGNNLAGGVWHPGTGMLYVRSRTMPSLAILNRIDDEASHTRYSADSRTRLSGPRGLPLFKPPYGRVTAIDMGTGETLPAPQGAYKTRCPPRNRSARLTKSASASPPMSGRSQSESLIVSNQGLMVFIVRFFESPCA